MNKHQLASTIWESANQMRSKIEANEYKDFILGFIFYKYLSERELDLFQKEKLSEDEIKKVDEKDGLSTLFQTNFFRLFFRYCTGV